MITKHSLATVLGVLAIGATVSQAAELPQGREPVRLDPADFSARIDNRHWPMRPGARWVYRGRDTEGTRSRSVVTATAKTRLVADGIRARALRDVAIEEGKLVEVAFEWYAQDEAGNVWFLREDIKRRRHGRLRRTGGWEAGVDGAKPGVVMAAKPATGMRWRQQHLAGRSADRSEVLSTAERIGVPAGRFENVVMLRETTPLEPRALEYKFYAPGVGLAMTVEVSGGSTRLELVRRSTAG
jgi:hypothetical protein